MSFKGFQKGIVRAPQTFKAKFNIGEHTKDAVYSDAERRFQELEKETKRLHDESQKYFNAINGMLNHQIEFSKAMTELYKPISGRASDPSTYTIQGNPEGIHACEEYEAIVRELQESLAPELEMIDSRIISPADQLLEVIKVIRKVGVKRDHKQLDYDRHRTTLKKLQDKKDKSLKDEKALYKAESDVEQATQEFNYYNDLLKDELPKLFALEAEFIRPLFQSFYYMQLNVFYTLHDKMQGMNIGYFDLTLDVEEAFEKKRGDVKERTEELTIVHYKTTGGRRPGSKPPIPGAKPSFAKEKFGSDGGSDYKSTYSRPNHASDGVDNPPPPYSAAAAAGSSTISASSMAAAAKGKPAPPPPKPKPSQFRAPVETVTALYDYEAQAHGDLSFSAGEVIEIVQRTNNQNEWWTGKVGGREGQFPGKLLVFFFFFFLLFLQALMRTCAGNYVQLQ
jgi:amphiphysin